MSFKIKTLNKEIIVYKTNEELISQIVEIKRYKTKAATLSQRSHKAIKDRYNWNKILFKYDKIV